MALFPNLHVFGMVLLSLLYCQVTSAQTITCPEFINVTNDEGSQYATVYYYGLFTTGTDIPIVCNWMNGSLFPVGQTTVLCEIDSAGIPCQPPIMVIVSDGDPPRISCPPDLTQDTDIYRRTATVGVTLNSTDNVGVDRIYCMDEGGTDIMWTNGTDESTISYGNHTITCEASDAAGLTANCTFQANITDNEGPRFRCPANRTVGTDPGKPTVDIYIAVSPVDNVDPNPDLTCTNSIGTRIEVGMNQTFGLGLTSISCVTTDMDGNSNDCVFVIEIVDDEDPVGECPGDITVGTMEGLNSSTVMFSINVTDNVDSMPSMVCNYQSGDVFPLGNTTVICVFTDSSNRTSSCMFDVIIEDNEAPRLACPDDITRPADTNDISTLVNITVTSTDNVALVSTNCSNSRHDGTYEINNGQNLVFYGNNTIFCEATDSAGLRNNCSFLVNITDEDPPTMYCPDPISRYTDSNSSTVDIFILVIVIEIIQPQTPELQCIDSNGNIIEVDMNNTFDVGSTNVTCLAADTVGNAAECIFSIEVIDDDPPVFQCPDVTLNTSQGLNSTTVVFPITVTDNVDPSPVVSCNYESGSSFEVGFSNVVCKISDASENAVSCMFNVIIEDNQPPVIECPDGIVQRTDRNTTAASVALKVNSTDNVNVNYTVCSNVGGTVTLDVGEHTFDYGSNPVFCVAADSSGLTSTCSFLVNITDEDPPMLTCPSMPLETYTDQGRNTGNATIRVLVTDAIDPSPGVSCADPDGRNVLVNVNPVVNIPRLQDVFVFGLYNVTCTASDMDGNSAECLIQVQVLDNEAPIFQCPDVTLNTTQGLNSTIVEFPLIVTDNVDPMPTIDCNRRSGDTFYFGNTTVQCGISDASENADNCLFNVIIIDQEKPVPNCNESGLTVPTSAGSNSTTVPLPDVTDNVDANPTTLCTFPVGNVFQLGTHNVMCTFEDASGNIESCAYTVRVVDRERPTPSCPAVLRAHQIPNGQSSVVVTYSVSATDNVDSSPNIACNPVSGSAFSVGQTIIVCVFTDQASNNDTCAFAVHVEDIQEPSITCPASMTLPTASGTNSKTTTFSATATDLVDASPNVVCLPASGTSFILGDTTVTCTATDASGNVHECSFNVRIEDRERPILRCVAPQITANIAATVGRVPLDITAEDNVDPSPTVTCSPPSGEFQEVNVATDYACTATDTAGNIASCNFQVTVQEPTVACIDPYESWYGECLLTSVLTTSLGILQINGVGVAASPDFVEMVGAAYLAFRKDLLETITNIVGLPGNRIRLEITLIQTGSIDVELNVAIAGRTEEEVTANTATFMDSSFTSPRNVNELSAGLDTYTMSFFQARAPTACNNYCQNGGICRQSRRGLEFCRCPDGFSGERCENTVTEEEEEQEGAGSGAVSETAIIGIIVGIFLTLLLFIFLAICLLLLWRHRLASQRLKWIPSNHSPPMEAYLNQDFSVPYIAQGGPGVGHTNTSRRGPKLMFDRY